MSRPLNFSKETKWRAKSIAHNKCEVCDETKQLEIHHLIPVFMEKKYKFLSPEMIKSLANTVVLCKDCHYFADAETRNWSEDEVRGLAMMLFGFLQETLL